MARSELAVSGFIHEIEKSNSLSNDIPFDLHQICHHFYFIPKAIFIQYNTKSISNEKSETIFKTINPFTNCLSKSIILRHSDTQMIQTDSLCHIPDFSNRVNLGDETMEQLNIDLQQEPYDAFFAYIHVTLGFDYRCYPSFILFRSDTIYDANNVSDIYAQLWISQREHPFTLRQIYNSKLIDNAIFSALAGKNSISVLNLDNITNNNFEFKQKETPPIAKTQIFEPQQEVSYEETLDVLLNGSCCIGVYDDKVKVWRSAIFMNKFDRTNRIMIRYGLNQTDFLDPSAPTFMFNQWMTENSQMIDKFKTLRFPADYVRLEGYHTTERDLRDMSNVPKENIDKWLKHRKDNYNKKVSYNDKLADKEIIKYDFEDVQSLAMPQFKATDGQNLFFITSSKAGTCAIYNCNLNRTEDLSLHGIFLLRLSLLCFRHLSIFALGTCDMVLNSVSVV